MPKAGSPRELVTHFHDRFLPEAATVDEGGGPAGDDGSSTPITVDGSCTPASQP